jgi:hypothetical protein
MRKGGGGMDDVRYRWVNGVDATAEEWDRIDQILCVRGWMSLNRKTSLILIAEDSEGILVGLFVLQWIPHTEPLWVLPSRRGGEIANELADRMQQFLTNEKARGWMLQADNPIVEKMAEARGMIRVESPVYIAK